MLLYTCTRCGKIHAKGYRCSGYARTYNGGDERGLRRTNKWKEKSLEIRERAHYLCEVCRDRGELTHEGLEVHHIIKVKDDQSLLLDNMNLICLCTAHHHEADEGKLSKEYLETLAARREDALD